MEDFKTPSLPVTKPPSKVEEVKSDVSQPKAAQPENPYVVPTWSKNPPENLKYKFEIQKNGQLIEELEDLQKKAYWTFGRSENNDVKLEHFSISRFHAVLQYRNNAENSETTDKKRPDQGWYIYDLNSTHGTYLNNSKQRIPTGVYIRMRVGYILRFGGSTRWFILDGPEEDQEPEISIAEMREQRLQRKGIVDPLQGRNENSGADGISWGMQEDANEEPEDLSHNPYAATNNEELFLDDPKKTLRGFFEREGLSLEYKCDEMSAGSFVCRVELPIDDVKGKPIIAEVVHKGKKKECVVQCALEACRILDRHGVLRQANQEPLKRRAQTKDSDSDEDEFWDRTGDIERRKERRKTANANQTLTYDDLVKKESELLLEAEKIEQEISDNQKATKRPDLQGEPGDEDDLDSFMANLSEDKTQLDKVEIKRLRVKQQQIRQELEKVKRLLKLTKPVDFSFITNERKNEGDKGKLMKLQLPMIGKRKQFSKFSVAKLPKKSSSVSKSDEEEVDDDSDGGTTEPKDASNSSEQEDSNKTAKSSKTPDQETVSAVHDTPSSEEEQSRLAVLPACSDELADNKTCDDKKTDTLESESNKSNLPKTRPTRFRVRNKQRETPLIGEDEEKSSEKYSKWLPPQNQSGDGITALNEKFGY